MTTQHYTCQNRPERWVVEVVMEVVVEVGVEVIVEVDVGVEYDDG